MGSRGSDLGLTDRQEKIVVGCLLGDGHLELNGRNVRLRLDQGLKQRRYLFWKYTELKNLCPSPPRVVEGWHANVGKVYRRWHVSTFSLPLLNNLWQVFYRSKRKVVPKTINDLLTDPISLAVWFMDDGYKRSDCNAFRFNTDCYARGEQALLQACLKRNFSLATTLHRKGNTWNIYVPCSESQKFQQVISSYILPSLRYKLPLAP